MAVLFPVPGAPLLGRTGDSGRDRVATQDRLCPFSSNLLIPRQPNLCIQEEAMEWGMGDAGVDIP